jgi:HPt (histidine-containing phosphotransfer) domain-containing protein
MGRKTTRGGTPSNLPDPAIFDIGQLRRYTVYQQDLEQELIQLFRQQLPQFVFQIKVATTAYDWKLATHSLKGSALTVGAPVVAAMAEELENLGLDGATEQKVTLLAALDRAIEDFDRVIQQFYH